MYAEIDDMLGPVERFSHPTFCVLPFYAIEYPSRTACCLFADQPWSTSGWSNNHSIDQIKQQMLQGRRPAACQKCWSLEDAGIKSARQIKNEMPDFFRNANLEQLVKECEQGKNKITHYTINSSNTCNAACTTCTGGSSSTWNKLLKKNNLPTQKNWQVLSEQTTDWIEYTTAESIMIMGGEPFLSETNFYILEQLIAHNNTDCHVSFLTNGSFKLSKHQKEILLKFKNLSFCFSIDGIGPVFEYLRWPLKWKDIENNISWCRSQNIGIGVSYTLSNMNLLYHAETTKWLRDHNMAYVINPVYWPTHFRPQSLPADVKQQLAQRLDGDAMAPWLTHSPTDDEQFKQFQIEVTNQDSMKNISIRDHLPELVALLKW